MDKGHRALLLDIKTQAERLAASLKKAHDAGFMVQVGLDNPTGKLLLFDVKQMIPVDLSNEVQ